MNDSQVKQQIQQMVSFIRQEAEDKANEIRTKAEEDFNIRKLNAVNEARIKIHADYEKKNKQIDVNRKIAQSTEQNSARLQVLKARDGVLREVFEEADAELAAMAKNSPSDYAKMLGELVLQGLLKLGDSEVVIRCRIDDVASVRDALPAAAESYTIKTGKPVSVSVDEDTYLSENCTGGITLLSEGGRIVVENTFESRLEIAYQQNLPAIRGVLFASS